MSPDDQPMTAEEWAHYVWFERGPIPGPHTFEECEYHPGSMLVDGECPECAAAFDLSREA